MRAFVRKAKAGFTLVELMIVVAIVGILAVLAIYGVRKYIANAKTTEARNSLGQMAKDATTAYEKESMSSAVMSVNSSTAITRQLCLTGAGIYAPGGSSPGVANVKGSKYQSQKSDWSNSTDVAVNTGFPCLHFSMDQPQYYVYGYTGTSGSGTFVASAQGDLNGDSVISTFSITGTVNSSGLLNTAPNIAEVSPEE